MLGKKTPARPLSVFGEGAWGVRQKKGHLSAAFFNFDKTLEITSSRIFLLTMRWLCCPGAQAACLGHGPKSIR